MRLDVPGDGVGSWVDSSMSERKWARVAHSFAGLTNGECCRLPDHWVRTSRNGVTGRDASFRRQYLALPDPSDRSRFIAIESGLVRRFVSARHRSTDFWIVREGPLGARL